MTNIILVLCLSMVLKFAHSVSVDVIFENFEIFENLGDKHNTRLVFNMIK